MKDPRIISRAVYALEVIASCDLRFQSIVIYRPEPSDFDDEARDLAIQAWHEQSSGNIFTDAMMAARRLRARGVEGL